MDNLSQQVVYGRILLKLSGEALQGDSLTGINHSKLTKVAQDVASVVSLGVQVGLVIGGGNLIRGSELCATGLDRVTADQMGMMATVINGLALLDAFTRKGLPATIMSAVPIPGVAPVSDRRQAIEHLEAGKIVIFVAGTGSPLVTTDSAAALRGIETNVDIILKATKVDGVFEADPVKNPKAQRYETLTYDEVLAQRLGVMDLNAILLCRDHGLPLRVFNMNKQGALHRIVTGDTSVGTLIQGGEPA